MVGPLYPHRRCQGRRASARSVAASQSVFFNDAASRARPCGLRSTRQSGSGHEERLFLLTARSFSSAACSRRTPRSSEMARRHDTGQWVTMHGGPGEPPVLDLICSVWHRVASLFPLLPYRRFTRPTQKESDDVPPARSGGRTDTDLRWWRGSGSTSSGAAWGPGQGSDMAEVTLGIGTSHSPMLSTPHEALAGLADLDRARLPEFAARVRES